MVNDSSPTTQSGPGGFFPSTTLPSPTPTQDSLASAATGLSGLPHPRAHPLRPGSTKEDTVRDYVEHRLLHISRRYIKKFGLKEPDDEVVGYGSILELLQDVDALVNVIWASGTPSLQVPYLLNIASEFNTYIQAFPPAPRATLGLLGKLDHCFASLLAGYDLVTNATLPGFENGVRASGLSRTDMVRCRSIIEATRLIVVEVLVREPDVRVEEVDEESAGEEERGEEELNLDVARVYEKTLVELGNVLGDADEGRPPAEVQMSDDFGELEGSNDLDA